jgi:diguanylate cyclase (GGDEF)-like protein
MLKIVSLLAVVVNFVFLIYVLYDLKRDKKYFQELLDNVFSIVIVRENGKIYTVNKNFYKYFKNVNPTEFKLQKYLQKESDNLYFEDDEYEKFIEEFIDAGEEKKVKLNIDNQEYFFKICIHNMKEKECMVLLDITKEEKNKKEMEELNMTDPLTKARNRRYFNTVISKHISMNERYNKTFSLIMFDIDHFKKINDKYGHDVGDKILVRYTKLISKNLRINDTLCRIGGEEFIIILTETNLSQATVVAKKLNAIVRQSKEIVPITMSFGVVEYKKGENAQEVYKRVDNALYKAKITGRDKVVIGYE